MRMPKFFRSRRPKHVAVPARPEVGEVLVMSAWELSEDQWQGMTDFERSECRRLVVTAPRFQP